MDESTLISALVMGVVEGLTEFIPVSSTGHLILLGDLLGFQGPPGRLFEVVIQLGAILAICVVYFQRLLNIVVSLPSSPEARRFVLAILLAFLPAAVIGVLAHGFIKSVLFSPYVVSVALIVGGIAILVDRAQPAPPAPFRGGGLLAPAGARHRPGPDAGDGAGRLALRRHHPGRPDDGGRAAHRGGVLVLPGDPDDAGRRGLRYLQELRHPDSDGSLIIAVGFIAAFLAGLLVVRSLVAFVGRYGFTPFGWYRIALGMVMLAFPVSSLISRCAETATPPMIMTGDNILSLRRGLE